ncbi:uncharacterized protein LOC130712941 [Lotus japonicus]|uniref:uncharacterized protein LOC130712941 n=1 Tax=Lotus japonicus TaxID=34305 RepID=UPI0025874832|nr:uncharacterized protein LOC130712941 [Lotus japonicus]
MLPAMLQEQIPFTTRLSPLFCFNYVEHHLPHLLARQFEVLEGLNLDVAQDSLQPIAFKHNKGKHGSNFQKHYEKELSAWNRRRILALERTTSPTQIVSQSSPEPQGPPTQVRPEVSSEPPDNLPHLGASRGSDHPLTTSPTQTNSSSSTALEGTPTRARSEDDNNSPSSTAPEGTPTWARPEDEYDNDHIQHDPPPDIQKNVYDYCTKLDPKSKDKDRQDSEILIHFGRQYLTRFDLNCMRSKQWVNNFTIMFASKFIMAEQEIQRSKVTRYIFNDSLVENIICKELDEFRMGTRVCWNEKPYFSSIVNNIEVVNKLKDCKLVSCNV